MSHAAAGSRDAALVDLLRSVPPLLIAGLVAGSARVSVGPPLFANARSGASMPWMSLVPLSPQVLSWTRL